LAFWRVASHGEHGAVLKLVFDLVHEPLDQIHSASAVAVDVLSRSRIWQFGRIKSGTGVFDCNGQLSARLDRHRHAHVLFRVAVVAMNDRIHERFMKGEPDISHILTAAAFFHEVNGPAHSTVNVSNIRGDQFIVADKYGMGRSGDRVIG
jgi:hypothetical protein